MVEQIVYLDTSVALRTILDVPERERLQAWMETPETNLGLAVSDPVDGW